MALDIKNSKGMVLDGVAASQAIDSSGEILDVEGVDISTLAVDGTINVEHMQSDEKDEDGKQKVVPGEETIGRILHAHKVLKEEDCESERESMYWRMVKTPFIYIIYRLYDGAGHRGAQAFAAQIRDAEAHGEKVLVRLSIEGSTLEREKDNRNHITQSIARRVSATLRPCNRTCDVGVLVDPNAPPGFEKKPVGGSEMKDLLAGLMDKHERLTHPAYTPLGGVTEWEHVPFGKSEDRVLQKVKLLAKAKLLKAIAAGSYGAAPGNLVGGSALQVEDRSLRARIRKTLDLLRSVGDVFDKAEFRAVAKAQLPEADDAFLDHFADVAEDYHIKRTRKVDPQAVVRKMQALTIDLRKTAQEVAELRKANVPSRRLRFGGAMVTCGAARTAHGDYDLLHEDPENYVAVPQGEDPHPGNLVKLSKKQEGTHFEVTRQPGVSLLDL